jgi:hypothetical protein
MVRPGTFVPIIIIIIIIIVVSVVEIFLDCLCINGRLKLKYFICL